MSLKTPIKKTTLQQSVLNAIRDAILTGELKPGEPISLKEIATQLDVSTMPVRESLRQLEAQGLVTFASQKEIRVTKLSVEDLQEFYWIRTPLELMAFERALPHLDDKRIAELRKLNEEMSKDGVGGIKWASLNRRFHMIIYGAENSQVLREALDWLWNNVSPYLSIYAQSSALHDANTAHREIIEAIAERDLAKGKEVLKRHLESGLTVVIPYFQQTEPPVLRARPRRRRERGERARALRSHSRLGTNAIIRGAGLRSIESTGESLGAEVPLIGQKMG
jgi:DNA-binding GntR family transcriptional regulator